MPRRITVDYKEVVIDKRSHLSEFSWTTPSAIRHFNILTPATPSAKLKQGIMFSRKVVLKTFVEEMGQMGTATIFVSPERWAVISKYLTDLHLPIPENREYRMDNE